MNTPQIMLNRLLSFVITMAILCNCAISQTITSGPVQIQTQTILPPSATISSTANLAPNTATNQAQAYSGTWGWVDNSPATCGSGSTACSTISISSTTAQLHGTDTSSALFTATGTTPIIGDPTNPASPAHMAYYSGSSYPYGDASLNFVAGHQYSLTIWAYSATSNIPVWFWTRNNAGQLEHYGSMIVPTVASQWVPITILAAPQTSVTPDIRFSIGSATTGQTVYLSSFTVYDVTQAVPFVASVKNTAVMPASYPDTGYYGFGWDSGGTVTGTNPWTANQYTQTTSSTFTNGFLFPQGTWRLWDNLGLNFNGTNLNWTSASSYNTASWTRALQIAKIQNQGIIYTLGDIPSWLQSGGVQIPTSNTPIVNLIASASTSLSNVWLTGYSTVPLAFEMWNETNTSTFWGGTVNYGSTDMVTLAYQVFTAVKAVSSNIKVYAPDITQYGSGWLASFLYPWPGRTYNGSGIAWDGFTFHTGSTDIPVNDINVLKALNFILASYGKSSTPIIMSEGQYDSITSTPTQSQQLSSVGQSLLLTWEQGASGYNYYLSNIPPGSTSPYFISLFTPTNGTTQPNAITPAGSAWINMMNWLVGSKINSKSCDIFGTCIYYVTLNSKFSGKPGYIIFNTTGTTYNATVPFNGISTELDLLGDQFPAAPFGSYQVTTAPVLFF